MSNGIPESDWKVFKQLHPVAVERYCERVLSEINGVISSKTGTTAYERYLEVYQMVKRRDKEMARAFDDFRRSTALTQIMIINSLGLITEEEMARFSEETRERTKPWDR